MQKSLNLIIALLLLLPSVFPKLLYTAILFRHGARYPLSNEYQIYDSHEMIQQSGLLTKAGMQQLYRLGQEIREKYVGEGRLFKGETIHEEVQIFTSPVIRCAYSALSLVLGFCAPGPFPVPPFRLTSNFSKKPFEQNIEYLRRYGYKWQQNTPWGQHTLRIQDKSFTFVVNNFFICNREASIVQKKLKSLQKHLTQFQKTQKQFITKMTKIFTLTPEYQNLLSMKKLYDIVYTDRNLQRKLPQEFTQEQFQQLKFVQAYLLALVYEGETAKAFVARIIKEIIGKMDEIIKAEKDASLARKQPRLSLYSGHDTNIITFLTFLNLTSPSCLQQQYNLQIYPQLLTQFELVSLANSQSQQKNCAQVVPFASNLSLQLHQNDRNVSRYEVMIRYNGRHYRLCQMAMLGGCQFGEFVGRVVEGIRDYESMCN